MKVSYNWLKDYVDLQTGPHELAERLSLVGLEVEEVIEQRLNVEGVVVGKVIATEKHPNADKLTCCRIDVGEQELDIVCGAPNVAAGQWVPVAKVGAELPNGLKIRKAKIRGVVSNGMICSEQELQLAEKSDGIWVLPDNLTPGTPLAEALNFETDFIFDIALTPNRPDCLSMIGVAREVAAILDLELKIPKVEIPESEPPADTKIKISILNPDGCPRYSARFIGNVTVGPSPAWLVRRLEAVGMRSINNIVDITNYVMLETGHPLHAFDYSLIREGHIVVRDSNSGEKFVTLDNQERTLQEGTILICDTAEPVAIGGIMGGLNSEVNTDTRQILLESAYFTPERIQISSRQLELSTEASQRFERGADPNGTIYAINRAAQLMAELCGGTVYRGVVDAYPRPIESKRIKLNVDQINTLLGTSLFINEMVDLLWSIRLPVEGTEVVVPTFRPDLERVADIAEEIARLYGLDNIPAAESTNIQYRIPRNEQDDFVDSLKHILTGLGLQEVITGSMINKTVWEKITGEEIYPILNPISRDLNGMRNCLASSLAQVVAYNRNRQIRDLKIFEINRIYRPGKSLAEQPIEELRLGIMITGMRDGNLWYSSRQTTDFYDIKGIIETLFRKISLDNWDFIYYSETEKKGDEIGIRVGSQPAGFLGRLTESIARHFELEEDVFVAEISIPRLFRERSRQKKFVHIPRFPAVERDLALIVADELEAGKLITEIRRVGGKLLTDVSVFDIYRGKQIESGNKSIALRLCFQSDEKTLTEEEVSAIVGKIINKVSAQFDAKLRD